MAKTRRRHRKGGTKRHRYGGGKSKGRKWTTAVEAASSNLAKTGNISKARNIFRRQALMNARKLFGSIGR